MKTIAILSPRILLSIQNLRAVADDLTAHGVNFDLINLNSGELGQDRINAMFRENGLNPAKVRNTTSPRDLRRYYATAKESGVPLLLISSTYHSAPRLRDADIPLDVVFNDEAHYLVGDHFQDCFHLGDYQYSFTATQKVTDDPTGLGMDNRTLFGDVVYTRSPKAMITAGEIVPPAIHIVDNVDGTDIIADDDYGGIAKCVISAFVEHDRVVKGHSVDSSKIGAKLLVTCDGQQTLEAILATEAFADFLRDNPDVHLFAMSTDYGILMGGRRIATVSGKIKEQFLQEVQGLAQDARAIIIHIDMLAEGLDVPGVTGIMPFRNLGMSKFLQTLGRATRLHQSDRDRLYAGLLAAGDYDKFVKPFAWVIIPRVMTSGRDAFRRYLGYVDNIRTAYDFTARDLVIVDDGNGLTPPTMPELVNELDDGEIRLSQMSIETFFHNLEDAELAAFKAGAFWHDEVYAALLDAALLDCA